MERMLSRIVLGSVPPTGLLLAAWWCTYLLAGDSPWIPWAATAGLATGLLLDVTALRSWTGALFTLPSRSLALLAVFYAVMIYGFFMGLPVPLLLIPLVWGFVAARPVGDRAGHPAARVVVAMRGSALIVFGLCCATAALAFREPSIARQVQGMLGLGFTPSMPLLVAASILCGVALVGCSYGIARSVGMWASRGPAVRPAAFR